MESTLDRLVEQACEGDEEALEAVVISIQDRIYNLALRMLWHPSDAEDATQEILMKVITHLRQFRQESACLDREHRLAYILGEVFEVSSAQGAAILAISETAFRKRISRARARLQRFMEPNCRLVNESKECNCVRHLDQSSSAEKRRLANLLATHPLEVSALKPDAGLLNQAPELRQLERVAAIYRSLPSFAAPDRLILAIKRLFTSETFRIFEK